MMLGPYFKNHCFTTSGHSPTKKTFKFHVLVGELVLFMKCSLLRTPSVHWSWLFNPHYQHIPLSFFLLGNFSFFSFSWITSLLLEILPTRTWLVLWMFCIASLLHFYHKFCLFYNWSFVLTFGPRIPCKVLASFLVYRT